MADTNLYNILSGLYTGLSKLNTKSDAKDTYISGVIGADYPADKDTIQARLNLLEAGTSAASGVLTIAGKTYTPASGSVDVASGDIIANVKTALAADATGLAGAADVYANDMFLSGKIDDIASSFLTGVQADNDALNVLTLGTNDHKVTGAVLVDGSTILNSTGKVLKSGLKLVKKGTVSDSNNAAEYFLADATGKAIDGSAEINIVKDQFLSGAAYDAATEELVLTFTVPSGSLVTRINVKDMVHEYQGSDAINVANTLDGKSAISLKLDNAGEDFLSITADGLLLSGVQAAIDAAKGEETAKLAELSGKVDDAFGTDNTANVVTTANGGITKSAYTLGTGALAADPAATTLATEAAVAAADAALKAELSGAISGAYTDDEIVIGKGNGIEASGYKLGADTDVYTDAAPAATKVMTEASFYKYAHTDLQPLADAVDSLVI